MELNSTITHSNPKSPISEAYRVLRTNIQFSSVDDPLKSIVITSSGPGEGKSTTMVNLAITFAQSGSRVILIDADLRKPMLHKFFEFDNQSGLVNILAQKDEYTKYIKKSEIENLEVITSGPIPPNPSELLASKSMKNLLENIMQDYDYVFLDAPPVGTVTDAAIISTIVDGTILVASSGNVHVEAIKRAKDLLDQVNANIVGVVLNNLDKSALGNYYYYYYYGENSEGKALKKQKKTSKKDDL